jgi:hypothetical protein
VSLSGSPSFFGTALIEFLRGSRAISSFSGDGVLAELMEG